MARSILIVEDIQFTRAALARILRGIAPFTIHEAATGKAAIEKLRELAEIDLIMADVKMAEMTGLELLKAVRSGETAIPNDTPFLLVSGLLTKEIRDTAALLDVTGVIDKPVRREDLEGLFARLDDASGTVPGRTMATYQQVDVAAALEPGYDAPSSKDGRADDLDSRIRLLESSPGYEGLRRETLKALARRVEKLHCSTGTDVLVEGQTNHLLFMIENGEVEALKASQLADAESVKHRIAILEAGHEFGLVSFAAGDPVDTTFRTTRPTDFFVIDLYKGEEHELEPLRTEVMTCIGRTLARRMNDSNAIIVEHFDRQLSEARRQRSAAGYVILTMAMLAVYAIVLRLLLDLDLKGWSRGVSSVVLIVLYLVPLALILRSGSFTTTDLGITLRSAPREIWRCVFASVVFLGLLIGVKFLAIAGFPAFAGSELFELATVFVRYMPDGAIDWPFYGLNIAIYVLFVPVQELIVRCGLQTLLYEFLYGAETTRAVVSILTSNLIFAAAHAHLNVWLAVSTFVGGLFWGWLFYRYRTIVGVSISHALIGAAALFALGLERLLA